MSVCSINDSKFVKENMKLMRTDIIDKIQTYEYTLKDDLLKNKRYGLNAEEIQEICPDIVVLDDVNDALIIRYKDLITHLIHKVKIQDEKITKMNIEFNDTIHDVNIRFTTLLTLILIFLLIFVLIIQNK